MDAPGATTQGPEDNDLGELAEDPSELPEQSRAASAGKSEQT
jgi:hypothetical protein